MLLNSRFCVNINFPFLQSFASFHDLVLSDLSFTVPLFFVTPSINCYCFQPLFCYMNHCFDLFIQSLKKIIQLFSLKVQLLIQFSSSIPFWHVSTIFQSIVVNSINQEELFLLLLIILTVS